MNRMAKAERKAALCSRSIGRFANDADVFASPAYAGGRRAQMLLVITPTFSLARRLQDSDLVSLGEVFTFLSGLYFRGKLAYANAFAQPDLSRVLVITPTRGARAEPQPASLCLICGNSRKSISKKAIPRYRRPLERDLRRLVRRLTPACEVVLLGSVATGKNASAS